MSSLAALPLVINRATHLVLMAVLFVRGVKLQHCARDDVLNCGAAFNRSLPISKLIPSPTLEEACRLSAEKTNTCLQNFLLSCSREEEVTFTQDLSFFYEELCSEKSLKVYRQNQQCLASSRTKINSCDQNSQPGETDLCLELQNRISCELKATRIACDATVASWFATWSVRSAIITTSKTHSCVIDIKSDEQQKPRAIQRTKAIGAEDRDGWEIWAILLLVSGLLLLVLLVSCCILYSCHDKCICGKHKDDEENQFLTASRASLRDL